MNVQARLRVTDVQRYSSHESVAMFAMDLNGTSDDPNRSFSNATPSAQLTMLITNPTAFGQFRADQVVDLVFSTPDQGTVKPERPAGPMSEPVEDHGVEQLLL